MPSVNWRKVWNVPATDSAGTYTIGSRVSWLRARGKTEREAKDRVANEFPKICGARASVSWRDVWDTPATDRAGTHTIGNRIAWLRTRGKTEEEAKERVANEFPAICGACDRTTSESAPNPPSSSSLTIVTQNLFWWNLFDKRKGGDFFKVFGGYGPYDILLFQECNSIDHIKNGLGNSSMQTYQGRHAVAVAWDGDRFDLLDRGSVDVGEDRKDEYYGTRGVVWVRLRERSSGRTILAASHHGPLPVNTGGRAGGRAVAREIIGFADDRRRPGDVVILGGDFNADSGSRTVGALKDGGFRLHVSEWVDHIFTSGAALDSTPRTTILHGTGSDHRGIKAAWSSF